MYVFVNQNNSNTPILKMYPTIVKISENTAVWINSFLVKSLNIMFHLKTK